MDVFNPDTWKQQWTAFMSAPYIMFPLIACAIWGAWWLRGAKSAERIAVFEDRLKFAAEKVESANKAKDEVEKQFQDYRTEVAAKAENGTLAAAAARVEAAMDRLGNALSAGGDRADFSGTVE
jgi:hypothetical protein